MTKERGRRLILDVTVIMVFAATVQLFCAYFLPRNIDPDARFLVEMTILALGWFMFMSKFTDNLYHKLYSKKKS